MPGPYVGNAASFLVETLVGLYILAVLLRFLLQLVGAEFYNPVSQFLVQVTEPVLGPVRRIVPGLWGIEIGTVLVLLALTLAKLYLLAWIAGVVPAVGGMLVLAVADLTRLTVYVLLIAVLIRVILSWIGPRSYNPALGLLYSLTESVMAPARRLLPAIGGIDLSPIIVFIVLTLVLQLLVHPLTDIGRALAFA